MKKTLKIEKLLIFLFLAAGLCSCNDDSDSEFEFYGEVITLKKEIDNTIKYAPAYYAYGNKSITSAVVTTPDEYDVTLSSGSSQDYTWYEIPAESAYSTSVPESGSYEFVVVADGAKYYDTESHSTSDLEIPEIDTVILSSSDADVVVKWENNGDADAYVIRVLDDSDEDLFTSYLFASTDTVCEATSSNGAWYSSLTTGSTYTVNVQALTFDSDVTSSNYYYSINTIAIGTKEFVWE